ncbi:cytosolic carboxypeptidase 3 [Amia ocellicauda]|uniref:cytosolic carboxypeptidase 3 n=1 Tax=Amia ocellicauda TaxID=2972642 RepID=UPI0034641FA7
MVKGNQEKDLKKQRAHFPVYSSSSEGLSSAPALPRTTQVVFDFQSGKAVPHLREPPNLYGVTGQGAQTVSRWPHECEVIPDEIHHIEWAPPSPEPLCIHVNLKARPHMSEAGEGTLIYMADGANKQAFFFGSRVGGSRAPLKAAAAYLSGPSDNTLLFEARFESGNLQSVVKVGDYDYELTLRPDLYTEKHTQWFYFRVSNTRADVRYRFTITNLLKKTSLYKVGQRPLLYSEMKAQAAGVGWHRVGNEVSYYPNGRWQAGSPCYSLSWTFSFPYDGDTCYFAHCYPYTYSNLRAYLSEIEQDPVRSRFCKIRTLCRSLAGNLVPVLTVTSPTQGEGGVLKPVVVVTARVHPGETNSSWVMKGLLDWLLGSSHDAALLRDSFVFKLVPMLNPDGVIVGNHRCSLAGCDLNRKYKSILQETFPTVWATKNMVCRLLKEREVLLYCDLHGHNRKHNVFIYGCEGLQHRGRGPHERVFPLMLSKNCPDMFSLRSCKFEVQRSKKGTGRVALWELGVSNSFTLETSFCGADMGNKKGTHFSTSDLEVLGFHFCDTVLDFCDPNKTKYRACLRELRHMMRREATLPFQTLDTRVESDNSLGDHKASASGSDSSDSDGLAAHLHTLANKVIGTPAVPKRELNKWRQRQQNPPEKCSSNKKAEILQSEMGQYLHSRMLLGIKKDSCGFDSFSLHHQLSTHAPCVPSMLTKPVLLPQIPKKKKGQHGNQSQLAGITGLTAEVHRKVPKSYTTPVSLAGRSNSLKPLALRPTQDFEAKLNVPKQEMMEGQRA